MYMLLQLISRHGRHHTTLPVELKTASCAQTVIGDQLKVALG